MSLEKKIEGIIADELGEESPLMELAKLHGDASYRTYYRAKLGDGRSFIVMQMPEGKSSVSEEVTNFDGTHRELPFINVERYLSGAGLPVPKIYHYSDDDHLMILEDLGDRLMFDEVQGAGREKTLGWYKKAVDLLVDLQTRTRGGTEDECVAFARSFDSYLLNWEFQHFLEYGIEARIGAPVDEDDLAAFENATKAISAEIEKLPYGFTHRDYQSRNLLIGDGKLTMIDFQDALKGPAVYDLVALTRDSYVKLADDVAEELLSYYASKVGREPADVRREYDLVTVQRKMKDAGRFVYIDRVKGNPDFLKFIPNSIEYVKKALARLPEHEALLRTLTKYVPEMR